MYEHLITLQDSRDAVICLSFSPQAKFIAAAGYGGVTVWDLESFDPIPVPNNIYNPRNPDNVYSACAWLHFEQADRYFLIVGSQEGTVSIMQLEVNDEAFHTTVRVVPEPSGFQVLSIDVYHTEIEIGKLARIAVATADNRTTVYTLSSSGVFREIFSATVEDFSLIAARFCKKTADIYVFELNGGTIMRLDYKTGDVKSNQKYGPDPMGTVCIDDSSNFFVACTGADFQMLRLDTIEHIQTFSGPDPVVRFPKVATFSEDGAVLIGGTDRGHAMVFDVQSGANVQPLKYAKGGLVQPVAACTSKKGFLAAIAGSTMETSAEVVIYQKNHLPPTTPKSNDNTKASLYRSLMNRGSIQFIFVMLGISLMLNGLYSLALTYTPVVCFSRFLDFAHSIMSSLSRSSLC
ncbi:WD40-repeat-containing domain protein [Lentinula edodes]|uniref:WD40-repeat-containing domain protein n=1 Tax=Lentinula lateritia TaxID=40482 RepID=A0A9W9AUZ8_9AGAR|nr:WD40-repeat-containing domain protein [Lentinula edodes]